MLDREIYRFHKKIDRQTDGEIHRILQYGNLYLTLSPLNQSTYYSLQASFVLTLTTYKKSVSSCSDFLPQHFIIDNSSCLLPIDRRQISFTGTTATRQHAQTEKYRLTDRRTVRQRDGITINQDTSVQGNWELRYPDWEDWIYGIR